LGLFLSEVGLHKEALVQFYRAKELGLKSHPLFVSMARALEILKDWPGAAQAWESARELQPDDGATAIEYAAALLKSGACERAVVEVSRAADGHRDDAVLHRQAGRIAGEAGDWAAASALWGRACELEPENWRSLESYARAQAHAGDAAGALASWNRVLALAPAHAEAQFNLGEQEYLEAERTGDYAPVISRFRAFLKLEGPECLSFRSAASAMLACALLQVGAEHAEEAELLLANTRREQLAKPAWVQAKDRAYLLLGRRLEETGAPIGRCLGAYARASDVFPGESKQAIAQLHVAEGRRLLGLKQFGPALEEAERALRVDDFFESGIALREEVRQIQRKKQRNAITAFGAVLALAGFLGMAFHHAQQSLEIEITGAVRIEVRQWGKVVASNAGNILTTPMLMLGKYEIEAVAPGYDTLQMPVWVLYGRNGRPVHAALNKQYATLRLSSEPSGASVLLNGEEVGKTPFETDKCPVGEVKIEVSDPELGFFKKVQEVTARQVLDLGTVSLERATLTLRSEPDNQPVFIGEKLIGKTPLNAVVVPPGKQSITVGENGWYASREVVIESGGNHDAGLMACYFSVSRAPIAFFRNPPKTACDYHVEFQSPQSWWKSGPARNRDASIEILADHVKVRTGRDDCYWWSSPVYVDFWASLNMDWPTTGGGQGMVFLAGNAPNNGASSYWCFVINTTGGPKWELGQVANGRMREVASGAVVPTSRIGAEKTLLTVLRQGKRLQCAIDGAVVLDRTFEELSGGGQIGFGGGRYTHMSVYGIFAKGLIRGIPVIATPISPPPPNPAPAATTRYVTAKNFLNVRQAPSLEAEVIGKLDEGARVHVLEESATARPWIRVRGLSATPEVTGWVHGDFIGGAPGARATERDAPANAVNAEINAVINDWNEAVESRDMRRRMAWYSDVLTPYYGKASAERAMAQADMQKAFDKYNSIKSVLSDIHVEVHSGSSASAEFDKEFEGRGPGAFYACKVRQRIELQYVGEQWRIAGERETKVYWTDRGSGRTPGKNQ